MKVKLNWALTPYIRSHNDSVGGNCLVSVEGFVDKILFELIKSEWAGYIQKNGKKTALYNISVIDKLLDSGHSVSLDGAQMTQGYDYFANVEHSKNEWIKMLSNLYTQSQYWNQQTDELIQKLKNMFGSSVDEKDGAVFGIATNKLKWTDVSLKDNVDYQFKFDLNYGIEQCMTWEEPSHEYFVPVYFYKTLKSGHSTNELKALVCELQAITPPPQYNYDEKWQEGYDPYTFEPKKNDWRWKNYAYHSYGH